MRRPLCLLILALLLALAATQSIPSAYGAAPGALIVPAGVIGHDHPASDGTLAAGPHMLPGMDTQPEAAKATVHDPHNPAWLTSYGTNAGVKFFPPRQPPAPATPQAPSIDVGAWRNLFPNGPSGGAFTVNGMADAPDGRVFVAIAGGGLLVYGPQNNGTYGWSTLTTSNGLASNNVTTLLVDNGGLYVGTSDAGLDVMDLSSGNWTAYNTGNSAIASNNIRRLAIEFNLFGIIVWLATGDNGVSEFFQNGSGTSFTNFLAGAVVSDVAVRSSGGIFGQTHVWVGELGVTVDLNPSNNTTTYYSSANTGSCTMGGSQRIVVGANNVLWFIVVDQAADVGNYVNGVCSFDGSTWAYYDSSNPGLPNNTVTDLSVDYAGRVWMSFAPPNGGGAVYDQGTWWITVPSDDLLYSYNVTAVQAIGEDVWWGFYNTNGLSTYAPNWRPFVPSEMGGSGQPTALRSDANLTLIGLGTGISWWDGSNWYNNALPNNNSAVTSFARSGSGVLWTGTAGSGVYNYNGSGYVQHTTAEGLPSNNIRALLFDQSGKFWVATNAGLALRGNGYWDVFSQATSQINSDNLTALAEDKRGRIWIGTSASGINIYDPKASGANPWKTETTSNGLPSNNINALVADPSGDIWAATANGLGQWDHKNHTWTTWNTSNANLPGNNILSVSPDPAGRIWAGTTLGLAVYDAGTWNQYHVSGSMARSDKVVAVVSDGNQMWEAGSNTVAVRGQITGPLGNYPPSISDFSPAQGAPLTTLTINGSNFDDRGPAYNQVNFTGQYQGSYDVPAQVLSASANQLTVQVPDLAYSGGIQVTSHHLNGQSATSFTLAPAVSGLSTACVGMGNELDIYGDGFISQASGYPYAYVKIGNGPWRPADAVDPTEIRQIIRPAGTGGPADTSGPVMVALGSPSGPTATSGQSLSIATPAVTSFGIQQGVQGEQMIWAKKTMVLVGLASSGGNCISNVDGGYLEWVKTDNTTLFDGYVNLPAATGLTVYPSPPALSLLGAAGFEMFDWNTLSEYPALSALAAVRVHLTNGPVELLTYDIPASQFNFLDLQGGYKMTSIHVYPTYTGTLQTEQLYYNASRWSWQEAARVFPQQDVEAIDSPNAWITFANPTIGRDAPVDLGNSDAFASLRSDGDNIRSLLNDSGANIYQATTLLDNLLQTGSTTGKAMTSCNVFGSDCNRYVTAADVYPADATQTGSTILQEAVHVSSWVDTGSPNYGSSNPAAGHSKYDEDRTTASCDNNTTFRQALIDQLGYPGRVIYMQFGQAPYQFPLFGCYPAFEPRSAMSYAPSRLNNNVFLEPLDYKHYLQYIWFALHFSNLPGCPPSCAPSAQVPAAGTNWRVAGNIDSGKHVVITLGYLLPAGGLLSRPEHVDAARYNLGAALLGNSRLLLKPASTLEYQLNLRAADNSLLGTMPFVGGGTLSDGSADNSSRFNLLVPFPANTTRAEIVNAGNVIWSQSVGSAAPQVAVTAPNGGTFNVANPITVSWTASEAGNPPLMFMLDYSGDNGASWHPISNAVTGSTYVWTPGFVPPAAQARVRVRASDGFHTATAASNPFGLTAQAPLAVIDAPHNGDTFGEGQTVHLVGGSTSGNGTDGDTYQWSRNGNVIGSTRMLTRTLKTIGTQVFSLLVTANGLTATQSVTVNVLPSFSQDGIPDAWKLQYKLNPLDPSLSFQDPSGKGLTILQSYAFGLDPTITDTTGTPGTDGQKVAAGLDPRDPNQLLPGTPVLHAGTNNLGWTLSAADTSPAPWVVAVSNSGTGTLNWSISGKPAWLRVVPLSGTAPLTVTFTPLTTGLPTGHYAADLSVTAPGAAASPQTIHVTLNLIGFQILLPIIRR